MKKQIQVNKAFCSAKANCSGTFLTLRTNLWILFSIAECVQVVVAWNQPVYL